MRKLYSSLLLLFVLGSLNGQYQRIAKDSRLWYSFHSGQLGSWTQILAVEGDTMINGISYPLLVKKDMAFNTIAKSAYLFEDTTSGEFIIYDYQAKHDSVRMDFSMMQGDTFRLATYFPGNGELFEVDSTYSITDFRNITRKVLIIHGADPACNEYGRQVDVWMEGIGSLRSNRLTLPDCNIVMESSASLTCVYDESIKIYGDTVAQCYKVSEPEYPLTAFELYPNPANRRLFVSSENPIEYIDIVDASGTTVASSEEFGYGINVSDLKPGMYLIQVHYSNGLAAHRRWIKP